MVKAISYTWALSLALLIGGTASGQDAPAKDSTGNQAPAKNTKKPGNMFENLLEKLDANHDGILTREEYFAAFKKRIAARLKLVEQDGPGRHGKGDDGAVRQGLVQQVRQEEGASQ